MCACDSSTNAISRGSQAKARRFFASASRPPWNMPQSIRNFSSPVSTR